MGQRKIDGEGGKLVQEVWATSPVKRLWCYCQSLIRDRSTLNCIFLTSTIPRNFVSCREVWFETVLKMLIEARSFRSACAFLYFSQRCWRPRADWSGWKLRWLGRERRGWTSDTSELNGGSSSVVLDWSFSGSESENCNQVDRGGVAPVNIVMGMPVDCKGEAGVSSRKARLESAFDGEEIGLRIMTSRLSGNFKPDDIKGSQSSSGLERTERQSWQGGKVECSAG